MIGWSVSEGLSNLGRVVTSVPKSSLKQAQHAAVSKRARRGEPGAGAAKAKEKMERLDSMRVKRFMIYNLYFFAITDGRRRIE